MPHKLRLDPVLDAGLESVDPSRPRHAASTLGATPLGGEARMGPRPYSSIGTTTAALATEPDALAGARAGSVDHWSGVR